MDLEMTGLDPGKERIIEIAVLITDGNLETIEEGPSLVVHQPDTLLAAMDDWNREHHGASGLTDRVRASTLTEEEAETHVLEFVSRHCDARMGTLTGNSIHQDRRFIRRYMPRLDAHLHYRMVDVSSVKELVRRWYPQVHKNAPRKAETHRALDDIRESIQELRYYREHAFTK
jgi:oligoribonuclease